MKATAKSYELLRSSAVLLISVLLFACMCFLVPQQAQAAGFKVVDDNYISITVPSSWKTIVDEAYSSGHTGGNYHTDFYPKSNKYEYMFMRVDGTDGTLNTKRPEKTSAKAVKYKGVHTLSWELKGTKGEAWIGISNVPFDAWKAAHGDESHPGVSTSTWKKLVKVTTGGKIEYSKLIKMSKSKAKSQGRKAVYTYMKNKVIPNIRLC